MNRCPMKLFVASLVLIGSVTITAQAEPSIAKFPLTKVLPADVFIAVAGRANPERAFIDKHWEEVYQAFKDSGVMTDVWELISDHVPDEKMEAIEKLQDRFSALFSAVDWCKLFDQEMVYGGRLDLMGNSMGYQGFIMGRMNEKDAKKNYDALKNLLNEIVKLVKEESGGNEISFAETTDKGLTMASLTPTEMPAVGFYISVWKDVLVVGFGGRPLMDEAISLLRGDSKGKGLVETDRFKKAFADLHEPEDTLVFFDIKKMMTPMKELIAKIDKEQQQAADNESADDGEKSEKKGEHADKPMKKSPLKIINKLMDEMMIFDYTATVKWTDDSRTFSDSVTTLTSNAKSSGLYPILTSVKPIKSFEEFIPKGAHDFSVSSSIDLTKLYHYILKFVSENVEDGEEMVTHFQDMQKDTLHLDIEKDVLSLFGGTSAHFTHGDQWLIMVEVTDEKKFEAQLNRLISTVNGMLGKENALITTKVKVTGDRNFTQVSHPMMAMIPGGIGAPVMGCARGYFMITSSVKTVNECLQTAEGKKPNITKSKRWTEEALKPEGKVTGITFTDEANFGQELQQTVGAISMAMSFGGMFATDAPPEFRKMLTTLPPILAKLAPVAGKVDFYQSSASYETFDGTKWTRHEVQNYKTKKNTTDDDADTSEEKSNKASKELSPSGKE